MSGFAYATVNRLTGLTASAFSVTTGAGPSGATELYLNDGRMDRQYTFTAGTTAETLQIDMGAAVQCSGFAVLNHNLTALGGGDVTITAADDAGFTVNVITVKAASNISITPPNEKDSVFQFANVTKRYWRIAFTHVSSSSLKIGEVFALGATTTLTRFMVDGSGESEEIISVGQKMLYGETRSTYFAGPIRTKTLRFQEWTTEELAEARTLWRATLGPVNPFIFIQSYEATATAANYEEQEVMFGRLMLNDFNWTYTDHLYRQPPEFVITSLGREAGA